MPPSEKRQAEVVARASAESAIPMRVVERSIAGLDSDIVSGSIGAGARCWSDDDDAAAVRPFMKENMMRLTTALTIALTMGWLVPSHAQAQADWPDYADAVVAADGSGQFNSVQAAIDAAPTASPQHRWIIYIKAGVYKELIYIQREKRYLCLIGEDAEKTVLTYDLHAKVVGLDGKPIGTFRTASAFIDADDFTAENLTFENPAGTQAQALAVRVEGDRVTFRNCRFVGWQDTMLLNHGRQYFEDCFVSGHVDFIFGAATAFFERCTIVCRKDGYITAASTPEGQPHGFIFSNCKINAEDLELAAALEELWKDRAQLSYIVQNPPLALRSIWDSRVRAHLVQHTFPAETAGSRRAALEEILRCRAYSFLAVPAWMEFIHMMDLSIGTRLHGNMLALQAGVPTVFVHHDLRVAELIDTMKLPAIHMNEVGSLPGFLASYPEHYRRYIDTRRELHANYVDFLKKERLAPTKQLIGLMKTESEEGEAQDCA